MKAFTISLVLAVPGLASLDAAAIDLDSGAHRIIEVADNVYAVAPEFAGANGAFIVGDSGVIVVDTHGSPASARTLVDEIARITDQPVRFVVNTHWHVDHHAGNEAYYEVFGDGVTFIAHDTARDDIPTLGREQFEGMGPFKTMPLDDAAAKLAGGMSLHGQPLDDSQRMQIEQFRQAQQAFIDAGDDFAFTLPDLTISNSLTLHADSGPVVVLFVGRAHTRGDLVVYLPEQKVLVAGDILTQPILWTWSGYPADYVDTLGAIEALDVDYFVIGHGGPILEGKDYLRTARQALETIVDFANSALSEDLSVDDAIAAALQDERISGLQSAFSDGSEQQSGMFRQMVGWTVQRAMEEAGTGSN